MLKVCQCCGHPLPTDEAEAMLSPLQSKLYRIVKRAGSNGIASADISDSLYANRSDGGPPTARNVICVTAKRLRRNLEPFGLAVVATRGAGSRYYLVPLERAVEFDKRHERTYRRHRAKERTNCVV